MGVDGLDGHGVFQGAVDGKTAEFSFFLENMGNRYVDYSLIGFTAAYNRAQNLGSSSFDVEFMKPLRPESGPQSGRPW